MRGQQRSTTFGARVDLTLDFRAAAVEIVTTRQSPRPLIGVLDRRRARLLLYSKNGIQLSEPNVVPIAGVAAAMTFHQGKQPSLLLRSLSPSTLSFVRAGEGWQTDRTLEIPSDVDRYTLSDINNDARPDALFFGKRSAGILVYLGVGDGSYKQWSTLFPDISVSDVHATDLNGDRITDLFLADWLSNRVILYSGIGRGIFAEQIAADLPAGPVDLALVPDGRRRSIRLGVTLPDLNEIRLFSINALGEFHLDALLGTTSGPSGLEIRDINKDGYDEVVTCVKDGLLVFSPYENTRRREGTLFAVTESTGQWKIGDIDGDGTEDAIVLSASGKQVTVLANAMSTTEWPLAYSVGNTPRALAVLDVNGDHRPDIAAANSSSSSVSLLINLGKGRMGGQYSYHLPENPTSMMPTAGATAADATLVTAHEQSGEVTVLRLGPGSHQTTYSVQTGPQPYVVFAGQDPVSHNISFLVRNRVGKRNSISLSVFQQISDEQFIETSLRPNLPGRVTALSLHKNMAERSYTLAFAAFEEIGRSTGLFLAPGEIGLPVSIPGVPLFTFPDSSGSVRITVPRFVDNDDRVDLVASLGEKRGGVLVVYSPAPEDGTRVRHEWLGGVSILNEDALLVQDLNGDGRRDLCFVDPVSRSVVAFYGNRNGNFESKRQICPAADVSAIRADTLFTPDRVDLILADQKRNLVSIIVGAFHE
jgi:hypothetical protein